MIDAYRDWFIEQYNAAVRAERDGLELEKARDVVAHDFATAVEAGAFRLTDNGLVEMGRMFFNVAVSPERTRRRNSFRKQAEYLLDALVNPEDGTTVEPILDTALPLGDGRDKSFRYWNAEDFRASTVERYRNAAAVTAAAHEHDQMAQAWLGVMRERRVEMVGECFA